MVSLRCTMGHCFFFLSAANFKSRHHRRKLRTHSIRGNSQWSSNTIWQMHPKTRILCSISFCKISSCYPFSHGGTVTSAVCQYAAHHYRETPLEATRDQWCQYGIIEISKAATLPHEKCRCGYRNTNGSWSTKNFPPKKSGLCHCSGLLLWVTGKLARTEPGLRLLWHGLFQYISQSPREKVVCQFTLNPNQHSTLTWLEL